VICQRSGRSINHGILAQTLYRIGHIAWRAQELDQHLVRAQLRQSIDCSDPDLIEAAWLSIEQQRSERRNCSIATRDNVKDGDITIVERFKFANSTLYGVIAVLRRPINVPCHSCRLQAVELRRSD
jgi:hypothetical protein